MCQHTVCITIPEVRTKMTRLLQDGRKQTVTEITSCYTQGTQKSIC